MLTKSDVRAVVLEELHTVLEEDLDDIPAITGTEQLHELSLNSLALARLFIRLEAAVQTDPFAGDDLAVSDVRTVDQLVAVYERSVSQKVDVDA